MKIPVDFFSYQLSSVSIAVNSWKQLMKIKINLESWHLVYISPEGCVKTPAQHFLYQLSSAINSCQQLSKTDENNINLKSWNLAHKSLLGKKINLVFYPKGNICAKFHLFRLMLFSSVFDSCWQLLIADDNWYRQLLTADESCYEKKVDWNFHVHTKVDMCAKFQISRSIFIFINCYHL